MSTDKTTNYAYNPVLQPRANKLRKHFTKAESCLWKYALKARKMKGCQFRRQRPVFNFIADFMCKELKLIIEVDGYTHLSVETQKRDQIRDSILERAGFKTLRFTDAEVLRNMTGVIQEIEDEIKLLETPPPITPSVTPPPAGDRHSPKMQL